MYDIWLHTETDDPFKSAIHSIPTHYELCANILGVGTLHFLVYTLSTQSETNDCGSRVDSNIPLKKQQSVAVRNCIPPTYGTKYSVLESLH